MNKKVVIASSNPGKLKEFQELLQPLSIETINQADLNIAEVPETASTFVENALIKARNACQHSGLAAISDDSGLIIPAIGGQPGLYSARFAGESRDNQANMNKVLELMQDIPDKQRQAYYISVIVYLRSTDDSVPVICQGIWHGSILREAIGNKGFGYDPIFSVPEYNLSAAQLDSDEKNKISHRYLAMEQLFNHLTTIETLI